MKTKAKMHLLVLGTCLLNISSFAQWAPSGTSTTDAKYRPGYIGIGMNSTPTQALQVQGRVTITPASTQPDTFYRGNLVITKPLQSGQFINLIKAGSWPWSIGTVYNTKTFAIGTGQTDDASFTSPAFTITNTGNVGVNTPAANYPLDVNGVIRSTMGIMGNKILPATAFGATANDATNDIMGIQNALNAARDSGGATVLLPAGQYHVTGNLTIPAGVSLQGAWQGPHDAVLTVGTTIIVDNNSSDANGTPFMTMGGCSALRGITIYYSKQTNPAAPSQFPWTIRLDNSINPTSWSITNAGPGATNGKDVYIENVTLANSFNGIDLQNWHERHLISGVNMCALSKGIYVDRCTDVSRIQNVNIHTRFWWTAAQTADPVIIMDVNALAKYCLLNLNGIWLGRTDWEWIENTLVWIARVGYTLDKGRDYSTNIASTPANVSFVNCGIDRGYINSFYIIYNRGCRIINCFSGGCFLISNKSTGEIEISNTMFNHGEHDDLWGIGTLTCNELINNFANDATYQPTLMLNNCNFWNWDIGNNTGCGAVNTHMGFTLISNCQFVNRSKCAVWAESGFTAVSNCRMGSNNTIVGTPGLNGTYTESNNIYK